MSQSRSNPWAILAVLVLGFFMILLDLTIVNIAIPSIITGLNAGLDQILWVINAYIMVYAVLLISAGRIGDIYGQRNLFAAGLAVFTIASAFCGFAQDTNQLIIARVVQGIGGAMLTPQTLAILTGIFPPERRGAAFGVWGAVAGLGAVAGPTLGGVIVTNWSWRWIFYINVPLGIITLILTFLIIPDLRLGRPHRLDLIGVLLSSLGLFGIVFGLIEGQPHGWGQFWGPVTIPMILIASVVVLVAFAIWERFPAEPLIPLSLFKDRNFTLMNWASVVISFGMLGLFLPLTIYLQSVLGMSAFAAGLTIAPLSLVTMVVAPVTGRLADKYGGKQILVFGFSVFALGTGLIRLAGLGRFPLVDIPDPADHRRCRDGIDFRATLHDRDARYQPTDGRSGFRYPEHDPAGWQRDRNRRCRRDFGDPAGQRAPRAGCCLFGASPGQLPRPLYRCV
ncbi:DHA2 family efflux MFS transporter permease subunit [Nitrolancea hollandica]|uniref:Major facilitator superfamily (MFS) profile domain-containing protein n=1 Tax=Nitrolancea hollandica Lb TaxID=1129897 RepID=I4EKP1_9BACT|nr:DHA2 family efflux MFS transporter permease subunit [Nitrolancea hollandica]CCF85253.1 membrane hypothetical protein [Nitrolancea hollandica Lb]